MKHVIKNPNKYKGTQIVDLVSKDKKEFRIKYQKCEHVNFNQGLAKQNLKLYILRNLINRGYNSIFINKFSYGPFSTSQLVGLNHKKLNCFFRRLSVTLDGIYQIFFREQFKRYVANYPLFYFVSAKLKK